MLMIVCRFPCWPTWPLGGSVLAGLMMIAGAVFSLVMLIDCLKRPNEKFINPLTKDAVYDRLIWAAAIFASLWFYFIGAIVYFFVIRQGKPEKKE